MSQTDGPHPTVADTLEQSHAEISGLFEQVSHPDADRPAVLAVLIRRLSAHSAAEKQHLIPALRSLGGAEESADRLRDADQDMDETLAKVERRSASSGDMPELVTHLLDVHNQHVEQFRQEIAPLLESGGALAADEDLAARIHTDLSDENAHPHPLLPDSGPLAKAGRAVAGVVDAARNRTVDR